MRSQDTNFAVEAKHKQEESNRVSIKQPQFNQTHNFIDTPKVRFHPIPQNENNFDTLQTPNPKKSSLKPSQFQPNVNSGKDQTGKTSNEKKMQKSINLKNHQKVKT